VFKVPKVVKVLLVQIQPWQDLKVSKVVKVL